MRSTAAYTIEIAHKFSQPMSAHLPDIEGGAVEFTPRGFIVTLMDVANEQAYVRGPMKATPEDAIKHAVLCAYAPFN